MVFLQQYEIHINHTDEGVLIAYASARAAANIAHNTIKHDLYAIQTCLFDMGIQISVSTMPVLEKVMHGIKKSNSQQKRTSKLPITPATLQTLISKLPRKNDINTQIYKAAFTIATFGMLRCGEFTTTDSYSLLRIRHLAFHSNNNTKEHTRIQLFIPASKTDLFRQGVTITLPCICKQFILCPVHETAKLITLYTKANGTPKPDDPLFRFTNNEILTRKHVGSMITTLCKQAQLPAQAYTGHSFRKGGATALAEHGAPDWMIQTLGRWKSQSYKTYIKTPPEFICQYIQTMLP